LALEHDEKGGGDSFRPDDVGTTPRFFISACLLAHGLVGSVSRKLRNVWWVCVCVWHDGMTHWLLQTNERLTIRIQKMGE
jgi:hypothetical protein